MFENYKIKKSNGKEILYIYIDISNEFALSNLFNRKNLHNSIAEFIKKNKIAFAGSMIALVINGAVIGNVSWNNEHNTNYNLNNPVAIKEIIKTTEEVPSLKEIEEFQNEEMPKKEVLQQEQIVETPKKSENKEAKSKDTTQSSSIKKTETSNKSVETKNYETTSNPTKVEIKEEEKISEKASITEEVEETKTYVTIERKSGNITLKLEDYIRGVVAAEMPAEFHKEALKAQAVIARTYTLKALKTGKKLTDNESTQTYKSDSELKALWGNSYDKYISKIKEAISETKGKYLTYHDTLIEAVYHSTSNGKTENAKEVWGNSFSYLVSVDSPYDRENKSFEMEKSIDYQTISTKLNMTITSESEFNITEYTDSGRVKTIVIEGTSFKGTTLRTKLGLRSTDFEVTPTDTGFTFKTRGYGHGVGLSQYGANGMAKNGSTYEQILKHYYKGVTLNSQ